MRPKIEYLVRASRLGDKWSVMAPEFGVEPQVYVDTLEEITPRALEFLSEMTGYSKTRLSVRVVFENTSLVRKLFAARARKTRRDGQRR